MFWAKVGFFGFCAALVFVVVSLAGKASPPADTATVATAPPQVSIPLAPATGSGAPSPSLPRSPDVSLYPEDVPSLGGGFVYSRDQIRYCRSQKIRLSAIEKVIDPRASSGEVPRFNEQVNDYNARCGHFQYRQRDFDAVTSELRGRSAALEKSAQRSWVRRSIRLGE